MKCQSFVDMAMSMLSMYAVSEGVVLPVPVMIGWDRCGVLMLGVLCVCAFAV